MYPVTHLPRLPDPNGLPGRAATWSAASSDPALKPNQPNQSIPVPRMTKGTLVGCRSSPAFTACRRPSATAPAERRGKGWGTSWGKGEGVISWVNSNVLFLNKKELQTYQR